MKALLEIHILQNFAPSNLNRDDTGSPKDAIFGGYKRARISSQSFKYATRRYVGETKELLPEDRATRTKRVAKPIAEQIQSRGVEQDLATRLARMAVDSILKSEEKKREDFDDHLAKVLVFFTNGEAKEMARILYEKRENLEALASEATQKKRDELEEITKKLEGIDDDIKQAKELENEDDAKQLSEQKKELVKRKRELERQKVKPPEEIIDQLKAVFGKGKKAVDLALFGRMLAEIPRKERDDAACQVAHPISTNAIEPQFDFYTAVDELKPDEETGAGMMGTVEFNSACYYRYANIDLEKFKQNLTQRVGEGKEPKLVFEPEQFKRGLKAFLKAFVEAKPGGKQNSFAAHNDAEYVVFTVRQDAAPRNLANAFEKPVFVPKGRTEHSLTELSIKRFEDKWRKLADGYGLGTNHKTYIFNLTELPTGFLDKEKAEGGQEKLTNSTERNQGIYEQADSLEMLIEKTLKASLTALKPEN